MTITFPNILIKTKSERLHECSRFSVFLSRSLSRAGNSTDGGLLIASKAQNFDRQRMEGQTEGGNLDGQSRRRWREEGRDKPLRHRRWRQVFCDIRGHFPTLFPLSLDLCLLHLAFFFFSIWFITSLWC